MDPPPQFPRRPSWIWPWRIPSGVAQGILHRVMDLGGCLGVPPVWWLAGAFVGLIPLLGSPLWGMAGAHLISALSLSPLLLAGVARDSEARGLGAVASAFLVHSAAVLLFVAWKPEVMAHFRPAGEQYWIQSHTWITTGESREYTLTWWLPAHTQLLAAMCFFGYLSLGIVPFYQGFHEVDLMNVYVGHLLVESRNPWLALGVGWHPWSLCRGAGYLVIAFEVVSFSFQRLTGTPLSTPRRRGRRWALGLGLLLLDGILKYQLLEPVRCVLVDNLIQN